MKRKRGAGSVKIWSIIILFIIGATLAYTKCIYDIQERDSQAFVQEMTEQGTRFICEKVESDYQYLKGIADSIGAQDKEIFADSIMEILKTRTESTRFTQLYVADPEGRVYLPDREEPSISIAQRQYFQMAIQGIASVEGIITEDSGERIVLLAVPIFRDQNVEGIIIGQYLMEELLDQLSDNYFAGSGISFIVRSNGEVLVASERAHEKIQHLRHFYENASIKVDNVKMETMRMRMNHGEDGNLRYTYNGTKNRLYYIPIGINDWYFLLMLPEAVIQARVSRILGITMLYGGSMIAILAAMSFVTIYQKQKSHKELLAAYKEIQSVYRTAPNAIVQFLLDEKLTILNANDAFYEFTGDTQESYNQRYRNNFMPVIVPKDREGIRNLREGMCLREFRICCSTGELRWVQGNFDIQNEEGQIRGLCAFFDISAHKKQLTEAEKEARMDPLTKLKNKRALQYELEELIHASGDKGALLLFDLDNFKKVNDILGHPEGDRTLQRFASCLNQVFRGDDFIGRMGGDEFVVFMRETSETYRISQKMQQLLDLFRTEFADEMEICQFSISAGIAITPFDGDSYQTLYSKADQALYAAKKHGKYQYCFYREMKD